MTKLRKEEVTKNEIVKSRERLQDILNTHVIANFRAIYKYNNNSRFKYNNSH